EGATYRDHLFFGTGCHPSAVSNAVAILGELATSPRYQGVEVERAILREELLETIDRDGRMIDLDNIAHRAVFGGYGLGLPIEGPLSNLEPTPVQHLEAHPHRYLVGGNAVVAVAGPLDAGRVEAQVERAFSVLPAGPRPALLTPPGPAGEPRLRYV